jgi:hypothetical protein
LVKRRFWLDRIETLWDRRRILWLSGVRRVGKTNRSPPPPYLYAATKRRALSGPWRAPSEVEVSRVVPAEGGSNEPADYKPDQAEDPDQAKAAHRLYQQPRRAGRRDDVFVHVTSEKALWVEIG